MKSENSQKLMGECELANVSRVFGIMDDWVSGIIIQAYYP
ncbi:conserved protein of unknown function [Limnospira indica PCC 8005]|uniref:Uncharacterized protein n=1 Tax=Limnospira indica PCC 8005 TaxID=376219 RepID=A0A9P1KL89_9CYAN|nr:conserved protein of unknown function [Limnospira indica PCC 8005]